MKWTLLVPGKARLTKRLCLSAAWASYPVDLADEILVVDSFSTDGTLAIAEKPSTGIPERESCYVGSMKIRPPKRIGPSLRRGSRVDFGC